MSVNHLLGQFCLKTQVFKPAILLGKLSKLFIEIIILGISCFERYRQNIIRCIVKYNETEVIKQSKVIDSVIRNPQKLTKLSSEETKLFLDELEQIKKENKENRI